MNTTERTNWADVKRLLEEMFALPPAAQASAEPEEDSDNDRWAALVSVRAMLVRRVETARQQCNDADEIGKNSLARRHRARMWSLSDAVREFDEITAGLL